MVRVVLDTNVIVSALLKPDSIPEFVFRLALEHPDIQLCLSKDIFSEYEAVLSYAKFTSRIRRRYIKEALDAIKMAGRQINTKGAVYPKLADPSDEKFISCAVAAKADFLITGNTKHFPPSFRSVSIVTPRTFCDDLLHALPTAA